LGDRSGLFKTGIIVGWDEDGTDWYSSLHGQKIYGSYSELAGSMFVGVKIDGLENFWNN
jgi:hypothetical protein